MPCIKVDWSGWDPGAKRLIGRPRESAQSERKLTTRYDYEPFFAYF